MKKTVLLILILLLSASFAFAATSTKYTKYGNIVKSGEYTIKGTVYQIDKSGSRTGSGSPFLLAQHAGDIYMESEENGNKVRLLIQNGKYHMISDAEKTIMTITLDEDGMTFLFPSAYNVTKSGSGRFDGKSMSYEVSNDDGNEITYWYNGSNLYAMQSKDDYGDLSAVIISSFEQKVDSSLFRLPSGYETLDMSNLFADWGWDDSSYDYDSYDSYDSYDYGDSDWLSSLGDIDWDNLFSGWDNTPHYYAFGLAMGLNSQQARAFETSMNTLNSIDWSTMNNYYNSDTDRYDFSGTSLTSAASISSSDQTNIRKITDAFKK